MPVPSADAPAHWSKDFVEHLRTVHFTLIALCLGLIVLSLFPNRSILTRGRDQLTQIFTAVNDWDGNVLSIAADDSPEIQEFNRYFTPVISPYHGVSLMNSDKDEDIDFGMPPFTVNKYVTVVSKHETMTFLPLLNAPRYWRILDLDFPPELAQSHIQNGHLRFASEELPKPKSIREFHLLWDWSLNHAYVILPSLPESCTANWRRQEQIANCSVEPLPSSITSEDILDGHKEQMYFRFLKSGKDKAISFAGLDRLHGVEVNFPITESKRVRLDAQQILIRRFSTHHEGEKTLDETFWKRKYQSPFDKAFRELTSVSEMFEEVDLKSAENILVAQADREGDAFEAVGMKVPAEVAVQFGVLLVLGVQLYMWLHLHEFGNRIDRDSGFDVA